MELQIRSLLILLLRIISVIFTIQNNCGSTIWPGTLTGGGTPQLPTTGFELQNGESRTIDAPPTWSGRFWARTHCSSNATKFTCATADCGSGQIKCNGAGAIPPATLVEFTLSGADQKDFFDVSLVDGFNLPVQITPQGGSSCNSTSCPAVVNQLCPPELSVKGGDGNNATIACKSACEAFGDPRYCCAEAFGSPETCRPTNYSQIFKNACPQAYSYAYDDKTSTFTCPAGGNYLITFCP